MENTYKYKMIFSYDGSEFFGYAVQPSKRTVEEEIEKALSQIFSLKIKIYASGRTDKGVHALNQVATFSLPKKIDTDRIKHSLNSLLPKDIYIKKLIKVSNNFEVRHNSNLYKVYEYRINFKEYDPLKRKYEVFIKDLDVERLKEVTPLFIGKKSFKNFTAKKEDEEDFIREIYDIKIKKSGSNLVLTFVGNGFMRYEIRKIVGTLIAYSENKISKEKIEYYLYNKDRDIVSFSAPPEGLYLKKVVYKCFANGVEKK